MKEVDFDSFHMELVEKCHRVLFPHKMTGCGWRRCAGNVKFDHVIKIMIEDNLGKKPLSIEAAYLSSRIRMKNWIIDSEGKVAKLFFKEISQVAGYEKLKKSTIYILAQNVSKICSI